MEIMASCYFFIYMKCQEIQIKNAFNNILTLNFNLVPLKVNTYVSKGINFSKDYQKNSYNKKN